MNTAWLDPMEEEEELNAFLLEEQANIMNHQQQLLPQTNDGPEPQVLMNTMATNTTATDTRAEDIISWLDNDDDDDVYIPSLPGAVTAAAADDAQEALQENLYNNLQMNHHHHHQIEEGILELLDDDDNNNNNNNHEEFMNDVFDHHHHPDPIIINPNHHFPVPESPLLLDLLCNINEFVDVLHPSHHRALVLEEIPPETNCHQSSLSSPPLLDQNLFFDDPDMSEFTLINEVDNRDPVISTTSQLLVNTNSSSSTTTRDHINEDHNRSHENVINNVSTMINKVIISTATDGVATLDQGDGSDEDDDGENNEHKEMNISVDAGVDDEVGENPNYKTMISTNTSTSSLVLASASTSTSTSTSTSACKNLVSERNRRRRLSQQLLALRSLVPNITKMDKRSVLVDALAYLRSIHEETTRLQNELKQQPPPPPQSNTMMNSTTAAAAAATTTTTTNMLALEGEEDLSGNLCIPPPPRMLSRSKPRAIIFTEIDTERIENQRFVVKITCKVKGGGSNSSSSSNSSNGVGGDVLRVMESLGFDITYTSTTTTPPHHQTTKPQNQQFLTTLFIRVRNNKHGKMTEEKLRECISTRALRYGITLQKHTTTTTS